MAGKKKCLNEGGHHRRLQNSDRIAALRRGVGGWRIAHAGITTTPCNSNDNVIRSYMIVPLELHCTTTSRLRFFSCIGYVSGQLCDNVPKYACTTIFIRISFTSGSTANNNRGTAHSIASRYARDRWKVRVTTAEKESKALLQKGRTTEGKTNPCAGHLRECDTRQADALRVNGTVTNGVEYPKSPSVWDHPFDAEGVCPLAHESAQRFPSIPYRTPTPTPRRHQKSFKKLQKSLQVPAASA
jgi:hypothetical protein